MSTVYLATHEILDRQVALKIMSPSFLKDGTFKECFINEGRIISKLNHPHIVHIYDIGISNDACYMAIELLEVGTLRQKIDDEALSIQDKQRVITQIASALNAAHLQNFIHRDIKPGNILFRKNGDAVLTDFGISKVQDTEGEYTTLGFAAGTPSYMPPEFSMGEELDHRADIYSLGVVFYEMLTGEKPYKAKTAAAISYAHVNAPIPELKPSLSHYQKVIDRALAKKPQDRFDSVIDFSNAIEAADISMAPTVIAKRADAFTQAIQKPQAVHEQAEINDEFTAVDETPVKSKVEKRASLGLIGGGVVTLAIVLGIGSYFMFSSSTDKVVTIKNVVNKTPAPQEQEAPIKIPSIITPKMPADIPDAKPPIVVASTQVTPELPFKSQIDAPEKPLISPVIKPEPDSLTKEQVMIVNGLLDNSLVRASTIIKEQIRITKNKSIIEEIKNLKMNSGRTRFITDTQRQIQASQQRIDDNIAIYYKNMTKLKAYEVKLVREQLTKLEKEQTMKQVNQGIVEIMMEHLLNLSKGSLTLKMCKEDLGDYAKNIASTF
ncbi:MAG: serine/threonine protein kinase [Cocleimonas sp.]|nr:serine/threonine protein kinase [Cocleimonas sp.]